jgi:hypothetical protein
MTPHPKTLKFQSVVSKEEKAAHMHFPKRDFGKERRGQHIRDLSSWLFGRIRLRNEGGSRYPRSVPRFLREEKKPKRFQLSSKGLE